MSRLWPLNELTKILFFQVNQVLPSLILVLFCHHENKSVKRRPPYTPLLYSETGVYRGIHFFLIFAPKHRLLVLVRTASLTEAGLTCTHNLCFEQNKKNSTIFHLKIYIFTAVKYCCKLHGRVCVMVGSRAEAICCVY